MKTCFAIGLWYDQATGQDVVIFSKMGSISVMYDLETGRSYFY